MVILRTLKIKHLYEFGIMWYLIYRTTMKCQIQTRSDV
jgi:hypothetical protein